MSKTLVRSETIITAEITFIKIPAYCICYTYTGIRVAPGIHQIESLLISGEKRLWVIPIPLGKYFGSSEKFTFAIRSI